MTRFRILAGFGSVADEEPTIDTALMLARALEADIAGYFVEDTDLLNLAALPFAKVVRPADRSVREDGIGPYGTRHVAGCRKLETSTACKRWPRPGALLL